MSQKRKYKSYTKEFKQEAVALVTEQGCSAVEAAEAVGVNPNLIYAWKKHFEEQVLKKIGIKQSMGDVGACWDNAMVERFFGSLMHDWPLKVSTSD